MEYRFLSRLDRRTLHEILGACGEENSELKKRVQERLEHIRSVDMGEHNYSSDRLPEYADLYDDECRKLMEQLTLGRFPILVETIIGDKVNKMNAFPRDFYSRLEQGGASNTLSLLEDFFTSETNKRNYEGTYNTFMYIKNYIYGCLAANGEFVVDDLSRDYDKKVEIVTERLDEIADVICEIKGGTKLQFSVGNKGLVRSANGTYSEIHPYQRKIIEAIAFGSHLDDLENGNYEGAKRLLYLPKGTVNRRRWQ